MVIAIKPVIAAAASAAKKTILAAIVASPGTPPKASIAATSAAIRNVTAHPDIEKPQNSTHIVEATVLPQKKFRLGGPEKMSNEWNKSYASCVASCAFRNLKGAENDKADAAR
ncbi:hypothetical protein [Bosea sp. BIWAKO-01]|uniref:hypothetical protein n=1 Tax=Bosea sp. BIWAKO-01 TaxID=506668 RepID=UPI00352BBAD5